MGFIWWALPTLLAREGVAVADITVLASTVTLPWVFKVLAGPLVDGSLGRGASLRGWILACQAMMVLTILPLAWIDWAGSFRLLTLVLVAHAVFAATQDVAIDTLAIRCVPAAEFGRINGWMQAGMLTGRAAVAAGTLVVAALAGPAAPVAILALVIAVPMLLVAFQVEEPAQPAQPWPAPREWLAALTTRIAVLGLLIAITAGAGFEFLSVVVGPLLVELQASDRAVSWFFGLLAPAGLVAGALLSGQFTDRLGTVRATALGVMGVGALVSALALALAAGATRAGVAHLAGLGVIYVSIGFLTTASYALFMRLSRGAMSATRFAMFMAMTNACEVWAGFAGGQMQAPLGHPATLLLLVAASATALPLLALLGRALAAERAQGVVA